MSINQSNIGLAFSSSRILAESFESTADICVCLPEQSKNAAGEAHEVSIGDDDPQFPLERLDNGFIIYLP